MLYQAASIEGTSSNRITSRAGYSWAREYQSSNTSGDYGRNDNVRYYQRDNIARDYRKGNTAGNYQRENTAYGCRRDDFPKNYEQYRQASSFARAKVNRSGFGSENTVRKVKSLFSQETLSKLLRIFVIMISTVMIIIAGLFVFSSAKGSSFALFTGKNDAEASEEIYENYDIPVEELSLNAAINY